MFKHLTRNLKLGLTAITILTAGAGAAFAQPTGFDTALDPIDDCSGGGAQNPSYCTAPVVNCINNPFDTDCATTLGTKAHTVAKVRYCGEASHRAESACATTISGVNAAHWVNPENWEDNPSRVPTNVPNPIASVLNPITYGRHQFLKGTASGLNTGDDIEREKGTLFFNTTTFNGRALDGDATDGVAFFIGWDDTSEIRRTRAYAGILSGTDLGAPVMQTSGTASWVGQLQAVWFEINRDFVLEVTFGGAGNTAGSIEALVHRQSSDRIYDLASHFHLKGTFDDSGMITGTVAFGNFTGNDREDTTGIRYRGVLTGLIGQEGAVGAFHGNTSFYSGGFVARSQRALDTAFLDTTCSADPFTNKNQELCYLEYADDRVTRINNCITGGNASDDSQCGTAIAEHSCISNPFASDCADDFADYYETAQTNRIQFCLDSTTIDTITTSNLTNSLCTGTGAKDMICAYAPFASICFDDNEYKDDRETKYPACHADPSIPDCTGVTDRPNAIAWADSFVTTQDPNGLPASPDTVNKKNQFLKGGATALSNIGVTDVVSGSLNLATATFGGNSLGGEASDGVAFFSGTHSGGARHYYAGILSGTDLGGPVTQKTGSADWHGSIQIIHRGTVNVQPSAVDFTLTVNFGGTGDRAGSISSTFRWGPNATYDLILSGNFDNDGIITGNLANASSTFGNVSGLIGQQGAVGAFYAIGGTTFSGGFVARPVSVVEYADWVEVFEPATRPATPAITQFLAGTATLITDANPNKVVTFATAEYNGTPFGGAATNGFATNNNGLNNYAGLLSGVNLGAPLTAQTAVGVWRGYLESHTQTITSASNFLLTVNFGAGSKAGTISATPSQHDIRGSFDDRGVIDGTVTRTHGDDVREATLTGLIGSGGAIGVFHNNANQRSLVGGFVARKAP